MSYVEFGLGACGFRSGFIALLGLGSVGLRVVLSIWLLPFVGRVSVLVLVVWYGGFFWLYVWFFGLFVLARWLVFCLFMILCGYLLVGCWCGIFGFGWVGTFCSMTVVWWFDCVWVILGLRFSSLGLLNF